jgi:hypothetical protein
MFASIAVVAGSGAGARVDTGARADAGARVDAGVRAASLSGSEAVQVQALGGHRRSLPRELPGGMCSEGVSFAVLRK